MVRRGYLLNWREDCEGEGNAEERGEDLPYLHTHQLYRGHTTPVNAWGAIGYGYKSPLIFIHGSGKRGAFKQRDYLTQLLAPHLQPILEAFAAVTHLLRPLIEPLFMEDGNAAHGHKSITNCYAKWRQLTELS
jgi:hypothetical protein